MKKVIMVGNIACGKTTLCQRLNGLKQEYKKTQALEVINETIDTPGEYVEHRAFLRALVTTSVEADLVLFIQDPTQERYMFSPGQAASFPIPVAGVVSKIDASTPQQQQQAQELLELAGADPIFRISSRTGEGIDVLVEFLQEDSKKPGKN